MDKKKRTTQINWDKNGVSHRQKAPQPKANTSTSEDDEIAQLRAEIAAEEEQIRAQEIEQLRAEIEAEEAQLNVPQDISRPPVEAAIRQAKRIGRAAATGVAGIADIPNLAAMGAHAAGLRDTPTFYEPVSGRLQGYIDEKTGGELRPENKAEEWADTLIEGAAPLAAGVLTGGASLTSLAAKNAAKLAGGGAKKGLETVAKFGSKTYKPTSLNVSGSLGSSAAVKGYQDNVDDPSMLGSLAAGFAGGLGGSSAANYKNMAAKAAGKITRYDPAKGHAYWGKGIPVSLADTAKGTVPYKLENIMSKTLGLEGQFKKHKQAQEAAIARNMGVSTPNDLTAAVTDIPYHLAKQGAEGYKNRFDNIIGKRTSKFKELENKAINTREQLDISDLIGTLEAERGLALTDHTAGLFDKTQKGKLLINLKGAIPEAKEAVYSKSPKENKSIKQSIIQKNKVMDDIHSSDIPDDMKRQMIRRYKDATPDPLPIEAAKEAGTGAGYKDLDEMRKAALQESIDARDTFGKSTEASREAHRISHMLSGRRHRFVEEKGGPIQRHNSKESKKLYEQYEAPPHLDEKEGMSHYVRKLTGSEDAETAFKKLTTKPRYLNVARQGLSRRERPKLAEAMITEAGNKNGRFSIAQAQTKYSKWNTKVKNQYLKILGNKDAQRGFKDTMKLVEDNKAMMAAIENSSGTAHTSQTIGILKKAGQLAAGALTGYGTGVIPALVGAAIVKGGAKLWTNQNFMIRVHEAMTATTSQKVEAALKAISRTANQAGRQTKEHTQKKPIIDIGKGKYVK